MDVKPYIYASPVVTSINNKEIRLVEAFIFCWFEDNTSKRICIPKGFVCDGASIPQWCWTITSMTPVGLHLGAAVVHDYLYQNLGILQNEFLIDGVATFHSFNRKESDDMFLRIMESAGVAPWKRFLMYRAVRIFGRFAWAD